MSSGKDAARDLRHGRRGGNWIPDGEQVGQRAKGRPCSICGQPMVLRQHTSHAVCAGWTGQTVGDNYPSLDGMAAAFPQQVDNIRNAWEKKS